MLETLTSDGSDEEAEESGQDKMFEFDKLAGHANYLEWSQNMILTFANTRIPFLRGLRPIVLGYEDHPDRNNTYLEEQLTWERKDARAQFWIREMCEGREIRDMISQCRSSHEMWDSLRQRYKPSYEDWYYRWISTTCSCEEEPIDFYHRVYRLRSENWEFPKPDSITDEELIRTVLRGLPLYWTSIWLEFRRQYDWDKMQSKYGWWAVNRLRNFLQSDPGIRRREEELLRWTLEEDSQPNDRVIGYEAEGKA